MGGAVIPAKSLTYIWEEDWKATPEDTKEFLGDDDPFFAGKRATVHELSLTPEKGYKFAFLVKNIGDHDVVAVLFVKTKESHLPPTPIPVIIKRSNEIQNIPISGDSINVGRASDYVKFGIVGNPYYKSIKGFFIYGVSVTEA